MDTSALGDDLSLGAATAARPTDTLSDSEVLTFECVGEFLGIDTDKGLYDHFRRYRPATCRSGSTPW